MGGARAWAWHPASRRAGACREGEGATETKTTGASICRPTGGRSKLPCWSKQNAQCSNCTAAGAGEREGSTEGSAVNATWRIPCGVQISVHTTVPRCAASACEIVGNSTAASIAKSASQQRRRSVVGVKVNTGRIVSTGLLQTTWLHATTSRSTRASVAQSNKGKRSCTRPSLFLNLL
jgi:hypothetical protein